MARTLFLLLSILVMSGGCSTNFSPRWGQNASARAADEDAAAAAAAPETTAFPRTLALSTGAFTLHEPQIEDHADFTEATAKSAAVFQPSDGEAAFGTIRYRAKMVVDKESRLVTFYDREVLDIQFPGFDDAQIGSLQADLLKSIRTEPETIPLDVVLGYVVDGASEDLSIAVSLSPPHIAYSAEPALLVALDGDPVKVAVEGADDLSIVVNTNWDLFFSDTTSTYALLVGSAWLTAPTLDGPWAAGTAPEGVGALPEHDKWAAVKAAVPGGAIPEGERPKIIVAQAPAELIVTDGPAVLDDVPGTDLAFVGNSASDIVFNRSDDHFYFLTSGRWFKATSLEGPWSSVASAPETFREVPADHARAGVRASVTGTPEAELAVAEAEVPQTAEVSRNAAAPSVRYAGAPQFEKIPGASVLRATNTTFDVFQVGDLYYLCHEAVWFVSESATGPWAVTDELPVAIYDIPPESPSHHVTYVKVYESTPETVYVGYTPGYHYAYVSNGVVVYGSGYYWGSYYNPYLYAYNPYWYYYPYPATYGQASVYMTGTGAYAHGHYAYGPYGGYWQGSRYNPNTGRYGGGAYAYDYDTEVYEGWSYNPRTDVRTDTRQAIEWTDGDSYETWGETLVQRDENWVYAERYGTEEGFQRQVQTSEGGKAAQAGNADNRVTAAKTADGEIYAGANGAVYRRTEDGDWEHRSDGEWTTVDAQNARDQAATRASDAGYDLSTADQASALTAERAGDGQGLQQNAVESTRSFNFDQAQLERDWSARTGGRERYESFRASRSSSLGSRSGGRSRPSGRRRGR